MTLFLVIFGMAAFALAAFWTVQIFFKSDNLIVIRILVGLTVAIIAGGSALIYVFLQMNSPRYTIIGVISLPLVIAVVVIAFKVTIEGLEAALQQDYRRFAGVILMALATLAIITKLMKYLAGAER